jgi:hypothetical protein
MSDDTIKNINDEWIKLLNYIGEVAPDDLEKIQSMNEKYGGIPKNLFEQGYRSGFNSATSFMRESIKEVED